MWSVLKDREKCPICTREEVLMKWQDSSCRVPGYWVCPGEVQSGQNVSMWGEGVNRDPDTSWGPQVPELKAHKAVPELCTRALNELSLCAKPSRPQGRAYGWGHHLMYLLQRSCMSFRVCCVLGGGGLKAKMQERP